MVSAASHSREADVASYLQDERFSQKFEMPAEPELPEGFVVTYSDFGYREPANPGNERVLLFCSPLLGR